MDIKRVSPCTTHSPHMITVTSSASWVPELMVGDWPAESAHANEDVVETDQTKRAVRRGCDAAFEHIKGFEHACTLAQGVPCLDTTHAMSEPTSNSKRSSFLRP